MKFEFQGKSLYLDGYLASNLDMAKIAIRQDWDMVIAVDGPERAGKSTVAQVAAAYCDPNLSIDNICFNHKQFRHSIMNADKYSAVVYDEAFTGLNASSAMSAINRALVQMMAEIGQKNLFVYVVMPTFFDLQRYISIWRSRALINIYTHPGFKRGYFNFYSYEKKKELYLRGKKLYDYHCVRPDFSGRFVEGYAVDETEYRQRKLKALKSRDEDRLKVEAQSEVLDAMFKRAMELDVSHDAKMKILGMPSSTYFYKLKQYKEMEGIS